MLKGVEVPQVSTNNKPTLEQQQAKIAAQIEAKKRQAPKSLSSVPTGTNENQPGRVTVDNSVDAVDLLNMMENYTDSDDPYSIDKLLSSMDIA